MTDASNYGTLSEGLRVYVDAMRRFIKETLQEQYGDSDDWFDEQVLAKLPKHLRDSLRRRQRAADGEHGPELLLDPAHFRYIINGHWSDIYEVVFRERVALEWIGETAYWRDVWAQAADKAELNAERILDTCVRVLRRFDAEAADQIENLQASLSPASTEPHNYDEAATDQPLEVAPDAKEETDSDRVKLPLLRRQPDANPLAVRQREEYLEDEDLQELVRDYWQHLRVYDAGDVGLLNMNDADTLYMDLSVRIIADLVSAVIERSQGWDSEGWDKVTYNYDAGGIWLSVRIGFPEWALPDDTQ